MAQKKKFTILVEGKEYTFADACREYNISYSKAYKRLSLNWGINKVFEIGDSNEL